MPGGGLPPWMRSLLEVLDAMVNCAGAVAAYMSEKPYMADARFQMPNMLAIQKDLHRQYLNLYLITAPMLKQQSYDFKDLPNPVTSPPALDSIPALYCVLSDAIFEKKIITVKFINETWEKAQRLMDQEEKPL